MITLHINGQIYSGWTSASVSRALNAFASSFSLTMYDYQAPKDIHLDAECRLYVDGLPVISGYIDEIMPSYNAERHELTFSGRSKTADLVDCAAIFETGQIMGGDVASIIRKLIDPFGIKLIFKATGLFPVDNFQLQQGESCSSAIEKLCALYGLVFYDDENGDLVVTKLSNGISAGKLCHKLDAGLSQENNILSGSCSYSHRDRFSEYIVKSQLSGFNMEGGGDPSSEGRAFDSDITRYRPLVLIAESSIANGSAQERATWEKSTHAGNSIAIDYMVQGWRNGNKDLWAPGDFVTVDDDFIRIKGKMVASRLTFSYANEASTTSLQLAPPELFAGNSPSLAKGWQAPLAADGVVDKGIAH